MTIPSWAKWTSIVVILITTLVVPLIFLEGRSDAATHQLIALARDQAAATSLVLIAALAADVFLPVPNGVINTLAGSLFGWLGGALVIWTGLTLGCVVGYTVGRVAGAPIARRIVGEADLAAAHEQAERIGAATLVIARSVPMFAELTTIAAGITGYSFMRFLTVTSLANVGVAVVFAYIGETASELQSGLMAFVGAILLPLVTWLVYRYVFHRA